MNFKQFLLLTLSLPLIACTTLPNLTKNDGGSPTSSAPAVEKKVTVSTLAGGAVGMQDGTSALFNKPTALAFDASNSLFVLDSGNSKIRKLSPSGEATAFKDLAYCNEREASIGVDASGNVYFIPGGSFSLSITKFSPDGIPQTYEAILGCASRGTREAFDHAMAGIVDAAGNVYVANNMNSAIDKIAPGGQAKRLVGIWALDNDSIHSNLMGEPSALAIAPDGTLYAAAPKDGKIQIVKLSGGQVSVLASDVAEGSDPFFSGRLALDSSGNLYYADKMGHRIRHISPQGTVTTLAGTGTAGSSDGNGTTAQFNQPQGIAVDTSGNVYVADTGNHRIRKITIAP
ncbi:MAG: hypothetical protein ACM3YO_05520 [Bacteroidota bacterium]